MILVNNVGLCTRKRHYLYHCLFSIWLEMLRPPVQSFNHMAIIPFEDLMKLILSLFSISIITEIECAGSIPIICIDWN